VNVCHLEGYLQPQPGSKAADPHLSLKRVLNTLHYLREKSSACVSGWFYRVTEYPEEYPGDALFPARPCPSLHLECRLLFRPATGGTGCLDIARVFGV